MRKDDARPSALEVAVGVAALIAPALHSITDLAEWYQHGFSAGQLYLNYLAFLPMPWLLLGLYAVHEVHPNWIGLVGALLYGAAFTYFAHTTLYALAEYTPSYEALWSHLGGVYTFHGFLIVLGGLLFAWSALRAGWLPRGALLLFGTGILMNLLCALLPVCSKPSAALPTMLASLRGATPSWSTDSGPLPQNNRGDAHRSLRLT